MDILYILTSLSRCNIVTMHSIELHGTIDIHRHKFHVIYLLYIHACNVMHTSVHIQQYSRIEYFIDIMHTVHAL